MKDKLREYSILSQLATEILDDVFATVSLRLSDSDSDVHVSDLDSDSDAHVSDLDSDSDAHVSDSDSSDVMVLLHQASNSR